MRGLGHRPMLERFLRFAEAHVAVICDLLGVRRAHKPSPPACSRKPTLLSPIERWQRATAPITAAIEGLERARALQAEAAIRLDAADYTLQHLLEELAVAMPIPADGSALRQILAEAGERRTDRQALAA